MTRKGLFLICMIATISLPLTLSAIAIQPLKELRAREQEEKKLASEASFTSKTCGTAINASIDWSTAEDWPANVSIAKVCDGALAGLETVCRNDRSKGGQVKNFVCMGDGSGPDFSGNTLSYGASPGSNGFSETKDYLESVL